MRGLFLLITPLFLAACQEQSAEKPVADSKPEKRISYSREIRPFIIKNCLSCHADFPLHDPSGWDLLHPHQGPESPDQPDFVIKWIEQGSPVDPHWATLPLQEVEGASVDDFVTPQIPLITPRKSPGPIFTASVTEILAGDFMEDPNQAISTGYLRQGNDSPEWRIEKVAREFLGINLACAKCHDHPGEPWSTERYQHLLDIFTTPYDSLPLAKPPLYVKQTASQIAERARLKAALEKAKIPPPISEEKFQEWLTNDGTAPQLPGLVAAYSFDDQELTNQVLNDTITESGDRLVPDDGAHGLGLYFDGDNSLKLTGVPTGTDRERFTISAWLKLEPSAFENTSILTIGRTQRGFGLHVEQGKLHAHWTRVWPQHAISTTSKAPLFVPNRWSHVAVSYDGTRRAAGLTFYLNGQSIETVPGSTELFNSVLPTREPWRFFGKGVTLDEVQIFTEELTPLGVKHLFNGNSLTSANSDLLRPFFQRHFDPSRIPHQEQISSLTGQILTLEKQLKIFLVMAEDPAHAIPAESGSPRNRLEFVEQLNPDLLARSLANEVWRRHFKSPLTHSLGFSGQNPSHPKLLEWLASRLKQSDYNVAELGKLIRSSKTWQGEWPRLNHYPQSCPVEAE